MNLQVFGLQNCQPSTGASFLGGQGGHGPPNDLGLKGKELNIWALDHIF